MVIINQNVCSAISTSHPVWSTLTCEPARLLPMYFMIHLKENSKYTRRRQESSCYAHIQILNAGAHPSWLVNMETAPTVQTKHRKQSSNKTISASVVVSGSRRKTAWCLRLSARRLCNLRKIMSSGQQQYSWGRTIPKACSCQPFDLCGPVTSITSRKAPEHRHILSFSWRIALCNDSEILVGAPDSTTTCRQSWRNSRSRPDQIDHNRTAHHHLPMERSQAFAALSHKLMDPSVHDKHESFRVISTSHHESSAAPVPGVIFVCTEIS